MRIAKFVIAGLFLFPLHGVAGNEPPAARPILQKARMSSHVVAATGIEVKVVNATSGKVIERPSRDLESNQLFQMEIAVSEVLAADVSRPIRNGERLRVRFGGKGSTLSICKQALEGRRLIYWLTQNWERAGGADYFYPFYGETNLTELPDKLEAVKVAVAKIRDASH